MDYGKIRRGEGESRREREIWETKQRYQNREAILRVVELVKSFCFFTAYRNVLKKVIKFN